MRKRSKPRHPFTATALAAAGGVYETANRLGLSAAAVSKWYLVPERWVETLSTITGLPPSEIRPSDETLAAGATADGTHA